MEFMVLQSQTLMIWTTMFTSDHDVSIESHADNNKVRSGAKSINEWRQDVGLYIGP